MSLQYIIDGYNLINHPLFPASRRKNKDCRAALLEFIKLKKLCGSPKNKIAVIFDGYPPARDANYNSSEAEVIFARDRSADEIIKKMLEKTSRSKNIIVVSDDKEIRSFVKFSGARSLGIEEFICRPEKPIHKEEEALKAELTYSQIRQINQELRKLWLE
jgi:predicted RNA-binding protein with PIN domain